MSDSKNYQLAQQFRKKVKEIVPQSVKDVPGFDLETAWSNGLSNSVHVLYKGQSITIIHDFGYRLGSTWNVITCRWHGDKRLDTGVKDLHKLQVPQAILECCQWIDEQLKQHPLPDDEDRWEKAIEKNPVELSPDEFELWDTLFIEKYGKAALAT